MRKSVPKFVFTWDWNENETAGLFFSSENERVGNIRTASTLMGEALTHLGSKRPHVSYKQDLASVWLGEETSSRVFCIQGMSWTTKLLIFSGGCLAQLQSNFILYLRSFPNARFIENNISKIMYYFLESAFSNEKAVFMTMVQCIILIRGFPYGTK